MSLSDAWAENLGEVELSMLYRTMNRLISAPAVTFSWALSTKGEQDVAWAVKHEFERRWEAQGGEAVPGGVWK